MLRRSLTLKLLTAFLAVGLVGTLLTAAVVGPATVGAFERFVSDLNGERPRMLPRSGPGRPSIYRFPQGTPERNFEARFGGFLLLGTCGAGLLALLLGAVLSRTIARPVRDLTEATSRLSEGELGVQVPVRSADELGRLAASFNQMSAELAEANRLRRQLTADVAHDLRTPLSILAGYTEALHEGKLVGDAAMYEVLHQQVAQLKHLVEDLRTLSLADAGELPLNRRPVDPRALLERTALAYMAQAEAKGVMLEVEGAADLPPIDVDPERLTQVLGNLVGNALRHTPPGGRVTLAAEPRVLRVRDTGEGLPPDVLPHVFDRFYRADRSRARSGGESGLGLAIARTIVEAHGGKITAISEGEGKGAEFVVVFSFPET